MNWGKRVLPQYNKGNFYRKQSLVLRYNSQMFCIVKDIKKHQTITLTILIILVFLFGFLILELLQVWYRMENSRLPEQPSSQTESIPRTNETNVGKVVCWGAIV